MNDIKPAQIAESQQGTEQPKTSATPNTPPPLPTQTGGTPQPATPPVPELIDYDYFSKVQLRVARIEGAEPVPKSSKLVRLQLDVGPLGKRQILAGIAKFYTPEALIGRKIIVVANLKPAKLMGLESQGMLLASSDETVTKLIVVDPGQDMEPGSVVR